MSDWLQAQAELLVAHPGLLLAAGFLVALLEALAVVGLLVPGILLLFLIAALVGWNPEAMLALCLCFALGAMAGDGLSYALGRRYRDRLAGVPAGSRRARWLDAGRDFFRRHGGRSVFIARFVGPVRPIVPMVAGVLGMPAAEFLPRMVIAGRVWAPAMVIPGALFGESLELAAEFGGRLVVLLLMLVFGAWLLFGLVRGGYAVAARRSTWWLKRLGSWLRRHPRFGRLAGPLLVPGQREVLPVLGLALVLLASSTVLLTALTLAVLNAPPALTLISVPATLSGSLRTPLVDPLFVVLGLAGSWPVALGVGIGIALYLAVAGRRVALVHWALAVGVGTLVAVLLDALLGLLPVRAVGPDLPFTVLTLLHGFAAVIAAKDLPAPRRKWLYLAAAAALMLFGFARLYLGQAELNGLVIALALGFGWLTLVGIAYRVRARPARPRAALALVGLFLVLGAGGAASANALGYGALLRVQQAAPPVLQVEAANWFETGRSADGHRLPQRRTVFGDPIAQRFDVQLAIEEQALLGDLDRAGWTPLPSLDVAALRSVFSGRADGATLPHLPRDFNGRAQEVGRRLPLSGGDWAVLRAWRSGWQLDPDGRPVWLVQVRRVRPATLAGLFSTWRQVEDAGRDGLEALRAVGDDWRWRAPEDPGQAWRADAGPASTSR